MEANSLLKSATKQLTGAGGSGVSENLLIPVRVVDIILDINHPEANKHGGYDAVGTIFYAEVYIKEGEEYPSLLRTAKPMFQFIKQYPLKNEIVVIMSNPGTNIYNPAHNASTYYLPNINIWNHPHHNALPTIQNTKNPNVLADYTNSENGAISRQVTDGSTDINLGKYFREQVRIKPLLPYEGDMILEGKYGNSIRLGHRNVHPNIIISNGRAVNNVMETTLDSSLFFMSKKGSIRDHFKHDTVEVTNHLESHGEGNSPQRSQYSYKWTLADQNKFDLPFDAVNSITKTFQSSMGRGLGPHKDEVEGATGENDPNVESTIYGYSQPQMLLNSDRVPINAKRESLFFAAAEFIHIGAQNNINISTSKTLLGNASTSIVFNTPLFKVHAPGKVYIDGRKNTNENGDVVVVEGLPVDSFAQSKIDENVAALLEERDAVSELLG